jgi:hypothetical protein
MNTTKRSKIIGYALSAIFLSVLTGCVAPPPSGYVETGVVVVPEEYVYYPSYQVYYGRNRHQYIYRDGHSWVSRSAPPHVSVDVLAASPSVRLDFHDHPSSHHATVVRQYPKRWVPPNAGDRR